ncbi:hypothetical protein [Nitrosospira multiformis]|nr:hypothetical protein [Nitrosospira multiformis]
MSHPVLQNLDETSGRLLFPFPAEVEKQERVAMRVTFWIPHRRTLE